MKKNQLLACLCAAAALVPGQLRADSVSFTTAKAEGESITLSLNALDKGASVDWGDGNLQTYSETTDGLLVIQGQVKGGTIKVSSGSRIKTIICDGNELTSIDLSDAPNLFSLYCQNNQLAELDLSACTKLTDLNCASNQLTKLNLSSVKNPELENVNVANNQLKSNTATGTSFTLPCEMLQHLNVADNKITSITVSSSNPNIDQLKCSGNSIKILNLANVSTLTNIVCSDNAISALTLNAANGMPELRTFIGGNNKLSKLDLEQSTQLNYLAIENNALTYVKLPVKKLLYAYSCGNNQLTFSSLPTKNYQPAYFSYLPQADTISVDKKLKKSGSIYYAQLCPSYSERNNEAYFVDFTDLAFDSDNLRSITFTFYGKNRGDAEYQVLSKASSSNKEGDYYTPTAATLYGNYAFLQPHDDVYFEITSSHYPDMKFVTTHFVVTADPTGIEHVSTTANDFRVSAKNGQLNLFGNGQQVKVYSADGKLVWQGAATAEGQTMSLPRGLYVVNGQKVAL